MLYGRVIWLQNLKIKSVSIPIVASIPNSAQPVQKSAKHTDIVVAHVTGPAISQAVHIIRLHAPNE